MINIVELINNLIIKATSCKGAYQRCPATQGAKMGRQDRIGSTQALVTLTHKLCSSPSNRVQLAENSQMGCLWLTQINDQYYEKPLYQWDSGRAIRAIINPIPDVIVKDVWVVDSIKCPPLEGEDRKTVWGTHSLLSLFRWRNRYDPDVIVTLGNKRQCVH